uniref:deleted in malignant brain tumors 1 protein isoform X2 n=1 Tax=Ciona intestinalis TaxID=7719 RepID=UPI000EF4CF5D|nr:deleted in malignant brain tumors 1 protein isoform X2 [Ciona intestinalis]|eukprot:XP_026694837.1 deleted in malignant brain tumors 1 protein isoform X2 [Ciona intestinalis]
MMTFYRNCLQSCILFLYLVNDVYAVGTGRLCGFNATATIVSGRLNSPNWPNQYPERSDCKWTLTTTSRNLHVKLTISRFFTEACCDYLQIKDDQDNELAKLKGSYSHKTYTAQVLHLHFHSDGSVQGKGFNASFVETADLPTTTPATSCGFEVLATDVEQLLNSPNWPSNYDNSQDCRWSLTASVGKFVQFNLHEFLTESCCDYLQIRDGQDNELAKLKGSYSHKTYTAQVLHLHFYSDGSVQKKGFNASFVETADLLTTTPIPTTTPGCLSFGLDLMFLLDGSDSLNTIDFEYSINFVKQVSDTFNLNQTRIGIMQFSHWFSDREASRQEYLKTEIELGQYSSNAQFNLIAEKIRHHHRSTAYTAHAIEQAIMNDLAGSERFHDPCRKKAIVVVTGGSATDSSHLRSVANKASERQIVLIAVGVNKYSLIQLRQITQSRIDSTENVHVIQDFDRLHELVPDVSHDLHRLQNMP